jgi:Matrixin
MRARSQALSAVAWMVAIAIPRAAGAYCQSAACPSEGPGSSTQGTLCNPAEPGVDCGIALQWRQPCVSFDVQQDASSQVDYATADQTLTQALNAWMAVDCGGGPPSIQVFDFGSVACDQVEYNQHGGNANILLFRDAAWPHDTGGGGVDTLALTTVTYDVDKGDIYDADIEVNTADNTFTTTDSPGPMDVDLLSVLTHETGHFLGLAHSQDDTATMFASYVMGTTTIRNLSPDDQAAICAAYPVGRSATGACTGLPRHGWAPVCLGDQTYVRCAAGPDPGGSGEGGLGGALALGAAALVIRGRRGSRGSSGCPRARGPCRRRWPASAWGGR